jgi:hypothetical protein
MHPEVDLMGTTRIAIAHVLGQFICVVWLLSPAWAQTTAGEERPRPKVVSWSVAGGQDTLALRDIARTGTPVDASPVAWRGSGPVFRLQHRRENGHRLHRFDLSGQWSGRFEYRTPIDTIVRSRSDSFRSVESRYEYRRYLFSDVVVRGFDIGAGVQGRTGMWWLKRGISGGLETRESRAGLVAAIVAVVRFHRPSRFSIEAGWANGGHIGRSSEHHTADPEPNRTRWGGGWLTDLELSADVALNRRTSIGVRYYLSDDYLMSSHRSFTSDRRSIMVGVSYAK